MIKKIFYTLLVVFTCFIGLNNVSAETNRMYMSFDGSLIEIGNTRSLSTGYKTFTNRITFSDFTTEFDTYSTLYARYAFCSFSDLFSTNSNVVNTNIRCSNNGSIGTLSFFTVSFNEDELEEATRDTTNQLSTIIYNTSFNIYSSSSDTFTLYGVNIGHTLDDFPSYDSNSDILDSLDVLNGSLTSILNNNRDILYYVMKMYENMVTCRDSYNLVNIPSEEITSIKTFNITNYVSPGNTYSFSSLLSLSNNTSNAKFRIRVDWYDKEGTFNYKAGNTISNYNTSISKVLGVYIPEDAVTVNLVFQPLDSSSFLGSFSNVMVNEGSTNKSYEPYGEQICKSKVDETNDAINESNKKLDETNNKLQQQQDFMNDDDTSGSSSEAESFFEGFSTNTYGLTSIITAPLELIGNIAGSTCSPLPLQIPFVGGTFNLPCMSSIYKKHFGSFLTVYQTITFGIVAYWVCIRIFALVKDFKNPEHDEIEVMDL